MRLRWVFVASLLMMLCLIPLVAWAQKSDSETWPIVYQDDFEDPTSGWSVGETEQAAKAYVDGTYEIAIKESHQWAYSPVPGMDFLDFTLDVDVRVQTESSGYFAVIYHHADWDNYYMFAVSNDGKYTLRMTKDGKWSILVDWTDLSGTFKEKETNHLELVAQGSTFSFFLNRKLVLEETDNTFQGGRIYLAAAAFAKPGIAVRFDNLVVRADPTMQELLNQARDLYAQGGESYKHWETARALDLFQGSLALYKQLNWKRKQADLTGYVGASCHRLSAYREAVASYGEALTICRQTSDRQGEAWSLISLGICYAELGDYKKAIDYFEQSLAIYREINNRPGEAWSLNNLGLCFADLGDYEKTIDYHEQSLTIFREVGDRRGEAASIGNLGRSYGALA